MQKLIEITVGANITRNGVILGPAPAVGQADCVIPQVAGADLVIWQRGVGPKLANEYSILAGGGFHLLGGDLFGIEDIWFALPAGVLGSDDHVTSYTNGYDYSRVIAALFDRLGWRAGTIEGSPAIEAGNMTSKSGRYFNDFHAILTPYMLKQVLEDPKASDAEFNAFLTGLTRSSILQALNGVVNFPEQLELRSDFDRCGEQNDRPVNNEGLFVYRRIELARLTDVAVQIDSVGLYFDADVTFPLYLFREGNKAPVWTTEVTALANEKAVVPLPDLVLSYMGANNIGGAFYFGYFQSDLGDARAIDESRIGWNCANHWRIDFMQSRQTGALEFDRKIYTGSSVSGGINLQLSAFKDWTTLIVKRPNLFDELIGLQMAARVIELALNNVRSNPEERILKDNLIRMGLYQTLDGTVPGVPDAPKIEGIGKRITRELTRVKKAFCPEFRSITYTRDYGCDNR